MSLRVRVEPEPVRQKERRSSRTSKGDRRPFSLFSLCRSKFLFASLGAIEYFDHVQTCLWDRPSDSPGTRKRCRLRIVVEVCQGGSRELSDLCVERIAQDELDVGLGTRQA